MRQQNEALSRGQSRMQYLIDWERKQNGMEEKKKKTDATGSIEYFLQHRHERILTV